MRDWVPGQVGESMSYVIGLALINIVLGKIGKALEIYSILG